MRITLNGKTSEDYLEPLSVAALLTALKLDGRPVLVELDATALRPREFAEAQVRDGSVVEIIQIAAGG